MGRLPGPAEVQLRMGTNSKSIMNKLGIKLSQTARHGAPLGDIDLSCKRCREWKLCSRWLASIKDPEAYQKFCSNVAIFDKIAKN